MVIQKIFLAPSARLERINDVTFLVIISVASSLIIIYPNRFRTLIWYHYYSFSIDCFLISIINEKLSNTYMIDKL